MSRIKFIFLVMSVIFIIIILPVFFIIYPVYKEMQSLEKKEKIMFFLTEAREKTPEIFKKNNKKLAVLYKKEKKTITLRSMENLLRKNHLFVEVMEPYKSIEKNEINLVLSGNYHDLLRFFAQLAQYPNPMKLVYVSINKDNINIVFKNGEIL